MNIETISEFRKAIRNGAYAWPGGYPLYFITLDGCVLSYEASKQNRRNILEAIASNSNDGWRIIAMDINWEDTELYCEHTGKRIESAYGEGE